jgi:hypothetical protein
MLESDLWINSYGAPEFRLGGWSWRTAPGGRPLVDGPAGGVPGGRPPVDDLADGRGSGCPDVGQLCFRGVEHFFKGRSLLFAIVVFS